MSNKFFFDYYVLYKEIWCILSIENTFPVFVYQSSQIAFHIFIGLLVADEGARDGSFIEGW